MTPRLEADGTVTTPGSRRLKARPRLAPWLWWLIGITAVASAVIISRRPDAFTNAQFYAEDGTRWFSDAYNMGPWQALFASYEGHFLLQPRLVALIATPFGIANAPLIYNIFGLAFQVAPILFFMSGRCRPLLPSLWWRAAISAVYLLMPSTELNVDIASAQFHLVILATLVLLAPPSPRWWWRAFDIGTIALCALTGAFVYVLAPVGLLWWWLRRWRWSAVLTAILVVGMAVQAYSMTLAPRTEFGLGASLHGLILIICDRIVLAGLFAEEGHTHVYVTGLPHATLIAAGICLLSLPVVVFAALRAPWELRVFALTGMGIAAAGLAVPLVSATGNQWEIILMGRAAERYFLMAQMAWVVTVLWAAAQLPRPWLRGAGWVVTAAAFASGLVAAWQYPAFVSYNWPQEARTIASAPPGTHLSLPINPGPPWTVIVTAK
jgi:hypothetical protein